MQGIVGSGILPKSLDNATDRNGADQHVQALEVDLNHCTYVYSHVPLEGGKKRPACEARTL